MTIDRRTGELFFVRTTLCAAAALSLAPCALAEQPEPAGGPTGAAAPAPLATIKSVRFLPEMWGEPAKKAGVLYQDGALATPVPGGTLWTFGDSFTGTMGEDGKPKYTGALSNTMAWLPDGNREWPVRLEYLASAEGSAVAPLSLLASEDAKTRRLWPLAGVWLEAKVGERETGRAYLFYGLIDVTGPGPWGFKPVGVGLARAEKAFGAYERLSQVSAPGAAGGPGWPIDASSIVRKDGKLYLYAPRRFKGEKDLSSDLLIARVDERSIEDPGAYEFFGGLDGAGAAKWVKRVEEAVPACEDVWGQASVAWSGYLGAYVLATSANIFRHDQIQLRTSVTPVGPWTAVGVGPEGGFIKVPERAGEETQLIYCAMLHPEMDEGGVITVTFCRMLKREWAFTNPEGVRVEVERAKK